MAKTKRDKNLYARLRDNGLRKKTAKRVSKALPSKGSESPAAAHKIADQLSGAVDTIRERAGGGSQKRSKAAKTRKAKAAKRRSGARKGAKTRSRS